MVPWLTHEGIEATDPRARAAHFNTSVTLDGPGAVALTHPGELDLAAPLSVGAALDAALIGRTVSFTMLVGYFAHGGVDRRFESDLYDPARLILRELNDPDDHGATVEATTRFRLLFGELCSIASRQALYRWWALCRWRQSDAAAADAWRAAVIVELRGATQADKTEGGLRAIARRVGTLGDPLCPFAPSRAIDPIALETPSASMSNDAGVLLLFLIHRAAEVRCGRGVTDARRIFHPKLYVVERNADPTLGIAVDDTVVLAGSANWSGAALSASSDANVELATVHRTAGHAWKASNSAALGATLARTARVLFEAAPLLASWSAPFATDDPVPAFHVEPATCVDSSPPTEDSVDPVSRPRTVPREVAHLAAVIAADIELALGIDRADIAALRESVSGIDAEVWGHKRPSVYQVDGALRLLGLLRRSRGVLLTDEPGLGKTLIAEIVTALLIVEAVRRRSRYPRTATLAPIRVSILAPARVLGKKTTGEDGGTQWHAHAKEVRNAVRVLLRELPDQVMWADEDRLVIRPLSNQSLSRRVLARSPGGVAASLVAHVVDDLRHLAESEVVVLDEAHNFRNGTGTATRALRFCLAMPAPGEQRWKRDAAPIATAAQPALDLDAQDSAVEGEGGRRILLLTATPFNNRIDDVRTQLGHFAKAMDWSETPLPEPVREAWQRRVADGGADLDASYWCPPAEASSPWAGSDFARLVYAAADHFESARALDDDDAKEHARIAASTAKRPPPSDRGPRYVWAQQHRQLGSIFSAITNVLAAGSDGPEAERAELRNRVDAMLVNHVVQRSRRQVLALVKAVDPDEPARMFRAPEQPRVPIAVATSVEGNEGGALDTFEADVLSRLFELVIATGEGTDAQSADARLTMLAYTIRYERGLAGPAASDAGHRGASNFIGFQAIGLVKRLQSSPYAFVMTLVRGLLRTCAYELALTTEILTSLARRGSVPVPKGKTAPLPFDRLDAGIDTQVDTATHRLTDVDDDLRRRLAGDSGRILLRLMGIPLADFERVDARTRLWLLAGLGDPAASDADHPREQCALRQKLRGVGDEPGGEVAAGLALLQPASPRRTSRRSAPVESGAEQASWVRRLLADVAQPVTAQGSAVRWKAGLLGDFFLALDWLVGNPGSGDDTLRLVPHVFQGVSFGPADTSATMDAVAERFAKGADAAAWLSHTLQSDRRAADLLSWLLAQTVARLSLEAETSPQVRAADLPAGIKSLVFSEYADTLAYLRALIVALHQVACAAPSVGTAVKRRNDLLKLLRARVLAVATQMRDRAVALDAGIPRPIAPERLEAAFARQGDTAVVVAAKSLFAACAILTSRMPSGARLSGDDTVPAAAEPLGEPDNALDADGDADDAPPSVVASSALDAFSPWYQIDPREGAASVSPWERLRRADASPVHALMATEVLAEGVNLQECGVVIHYDLPWNPTRLIQRNGRVDRRIDPRVEDTEARRERAGALVNEATRPEALALADRYWPPRHVYHLTVPPIEPALAADARRAYARKVREILFTKLSGIREVFGLSAWPIVLEQDEAQRVLDGSLAYETQAFRRREELFVAHETMSRLAARAPVGASAGSGCLRVHVHPALFGRIHRALAGMADDDPATIPSERLRALAVLAWSRALPWRIPVRSQVDYRPLSHALTDDGAYADHFRAHFGVDPQQAGFLNLVAWVDDPGHNEAAMLGWVEGATSGAKPMRYLAPRLLRADGALVEWASPTRFSWRELTGATDAVDTAEVDAPTAAFEVALVTLARALDTSEANDSSRDIVSIEEVAGELPEDDTAAAPWLARESYWPRASGRTMEESFWAEEVVVVPLPDKTRTNLLIVPSSSATPP